MKKTRLTITAFLALLCALVLAPLGTALAAPDNVLAAVPIDGYLSPYAKFSGYLNVSRLDLNMEANPVAGWLLIQGHLVGTVTTNDGQSYRVDQMIYGTETQLARVSPSSTTCGDLIFNPGPITITSTDLTLDPFAATLKPEGDTIGMMLCDLVKSKDSGASPQKLNLQIAAINAALGGANPSDSPVHRILPPSRIR